MKRTVKSATFLGLMLVFMIFVGVQAACVDEISLTAENTVNGTALEWNEQEGVYYYEVYRKEGKKGQNTLLSKVQSTEYTDTEVTGGKLYYYTVKSVYNDLSVSSKTDSTTSYYIGAAEITSASSAKQGIEIEWSVIREALGYEVLRKAENEEEWNTIARCSRAATVYTDKTAEDSVRYTYTVRGFAGKFKGHESEPVEISYIGYPKLKGGSSSEKGVKFSWSAVKDSKYYYIYRQSLKEGKWKPYALVDSVYTSYEDCEAQPGADYSYVVRAVNEDGKTSHYDKAVTLRHIGVPKIRKIEGSPSGVKVTWTKSEGCQGYALYRKNSTQSNWKLVSLVKGADKLVAVDKRVTNSDIYTYTVRALWKKSLSAYDEEGTSFRYLQAPQKLECDTDTASGNVIKWIENDEASTYLVYRRGGNSKKWSFLGKTDEGFFADKKAEAGKRYDYTVKAYSGSNYFSSASHAVSTHDRKINPNRKMVALTFDDGPSDVHTNGILDILQKYRAKATFFVVGENIYYGRYAMARAAKMGCEIGTHTYSHIDLPSSSDEEIREEIKWTDDLVKEYTGKPTKVARAPGGEIDDRSAKIVNKPFFYWNVDTRDWESQDADSIIDIVTSSTEDGDIILMHDVYDSTLEAVEYIVPWLVREGYQLVTVSELLHYKGNVRPKAAVTYYSGFGDTSYVEEWE